LPVEILPDLFFIERGFLNGNHFVYRGRPPVLIDTAYLRGFAQTEAQIAALGVDLAEAALIVNTHIHCDHVGGNRIIQDRSGCRIALHRLGKHFIDAGDDWAAWWRYYHQEAEFFECTTALEDGDVLAVGPHEFEVIYTPGHSSDGIVLYHCRAKILLSSDTLWENGLAVMTERIEGSRSLFSQLESLDRLASLDVTTVYPGHGPPFTDFKGALARAKNLLTEMLADRKKIGRDLLKKITIYTLLMHPGLEEAGFLAYLMTTHWFKETVDFYFDGDYEGLYRETMESLLERGLVVRRNGLLSATVKP